ncbi:MAG: hypothetical protein ACK55O_08560 [Phycisphaerales bacterium]|jgi:hypothetical protein|nr:hypothetical protein [Phycisphaeraceae bacterium]
MVNGLPGAGIGGFFYLILALYMPIREGVRAVRGRSRREHWNFIMQQWAIIGAILVGLWLQGWLLRELFLSAPMMSITALVDPTGMMAKPAFDVAGAAATAALVSLAGVVLIAEGLKFLLDFTNND